MPLGGRSWDDWIAQYAGSHRHPLNRLTHTVGIPLIVLSLLCAPAVAFRASFWPVPAGLFALGWLLQFTGHAFEGKPPEFLHDWRFLFVGVRWWWAKLRGRA